MSSLYRPDTETAGLVMERLRPNRDAEEEPIRRCLGKGAPNRRIIAERTVGRVEWGYHATKGWRRRRV